MKTLFPVIFIIFLVLQFSSWLEVLKNENRVSSHDGLPPSLPPFDHLVSKTELKLHFPLDDIRLWSLKKNHGIELLLNWATCPTGIIISSSSNLPLNSSMSETFLHHKSNLMKKMDGAKSSHFNGYQAVYNYLCNNMQLKPPHIVYKLLKMSHLNFWVLAFSTNFCPIKTDLSGNTIWPQASGFQKLAKMIHFGIFN